MPLKEKREFEREVEIKERKGWESNCEGMRERQRVFVERI